MPSLDINRQKLNEIIEDLKYIFSLDEIDASDIDSVISRLKSQEVKSYIEDLARGSKPEAALREALLAGNSVLGKYLFGYAKASPEARENVSGFVDYKITDQSQHVIFLELKSLFAPIRDKTGAIKKLKQQKLNWEAHKEQIKKYIKGEAEYVVLTNLKDWVFFSRGLNPDDLKPFYSTTFLELIREYEVIGNLKDYADRKEYQSEREELDEKFFDSLKGWVKKLTEVEFEDNGRKLELIIGLINKFIFIQTLDDYGVIEFKWVRNKWDQAERDWKSKGKMRVLEEFLSYVDKFFYDYYDTELFRDSILKYVKKDPKNIERLYDSLKTVLGLTYYEQPVIKGIMQYNFRLINEDVLGKAYETFLAEQRKEQGAYYTPRYITEYIVKNTVGRLYDELLEEIKKSLEAEDLDRALELVKRFTSVKVLDPACGSGSFLIKALRVIKSRYDELNKMVEEFERKHTKSLLDYMQGEKRRKINEIKNIIGSENERELISKIILRHIYGVDLDERALEIAKLNIWLEAIKIAPSEFRFDKLPSDVEHILPNLHLNLGNGDSLISLPFEDMVSWLNRYKNELTKLRLEYLNNPSDPRPVEEIEDIKQKIRGELDAEFRELLSRKNLTKLMDFAKPFYWCLEFWFAFFDDSGEPLPNPGFDVIIGNPPYGRIKQLIKEKENKDVLSKYYSLAFSHQGGNYNYYKLFLERSYSLLKESGYFSMIFPTAFLGEEDSRSLRKLFFENTQVLKILQFPEKTKVFQDVTQDVTVLVYKKTRASADYTFEVKTNITSEELKDLDRLSFLQLKVSEIKEYDYRIPVFSKPKEEWDILKKISKIPPFKGIGEIGEGELHETKHKEFLSEKTTGDLVVKGIHLDQYFVNLDPDGPQPRWVRKDDFLKKKPEAGENIRHERIIGRNTLNRAVRPRLRFALLQPGIVITNSIKYIIPKDKELDKYYIIAVLNSSLLNWRFELFSSQNNIRNYEIEELPFLRADAKGQQTIASIVKRIIELKQARYTWFKLWDVWQKRLKNRETTLYDILKEDLNSLRYGKSNRAWSRKASAYPESEKQFDDFEVRGIGATLRIYGMTGDSYEVAGEIEFTDEKLMRVVYASVVSALESSSKISNLSQLLKKTVIPLITPNEKSNTANILTNIGKEWANSSIPPDIVEIDNKIRDLTAEVDAYVFKLYGLNKDEARVVLESLGVSPLYKDEVLKHFY